MATRTRMALFVVGLSLAAAGTAADAGAATGKLTIAPTGSNDQYVLVASGDYSG